ncbi:MAG: phosphate ABC transporter ATP-binding protein, partial [Chloroflexi bacterium]|nr:phosphate ABC transporter ATP-binding protein [Chloroflexota bacterium]
MTSLIKNQDSASITKSKEKIKIKDLNFWYGEKKILHDINLVLEDKKITALIGLSG